MNEEQRRRKAKERARQKKIKRMRRQRRILIFCMLVILAGVGFAGYKIFFDRVYAKCERKRNSWDKYAEKGTVGGKAYEKRKI